MQKGTNSFFFLLIFVLLAVFFFIYLVDFRMPCLEISKNIYQILARFIKLIWCLFFFCNGNFIFIIACLGFGFFTFYFIGVSWKLLLTFAKGTHTIPVQYLEIRISSKVEKQIKRVKFFFIHFHFHSLNY